MVKNFLFSLKIRSLKEKIKQSQEDFRNGVAFNPFLKINYATWKEIELLPGVDKVCAKSLVLQIKKIRKIKDIDEFMRITGADISLKEINEKIIKFS